LDLSSSPCLKRLAPLAPLLLLLRHQLQHILQQLLQD
jgi:hypothetical protein